MPAANDARPLPATDPHHLPTTARTLLRAVLVVLAIYFGGQLASAYPHVGSTIALLWPPAGIALAALWRWGPAQLPAVALGAAWLAWSATGSPTVAAAVALGHTAAPALAAWWLEQRGFDDTLADRRDLTLWLIAASVSSLLIAVNGVYWLTPPSFGADETARLLLQTWVCMALGVLVVGVALLTLTRSAILRALRPSRRAGTLMLPLGVLATSYAAFVAQPTASHVLTALAFVPHVLLAVLVMRSGLPVASWSVALVAAAAGYAGAFGLGPFESAPPMVALALQWGYLASLVAIVLLVAAFTGETARLKQRWQLALQGPNLGVADWPLRGGAGFTSRRWRHLLGDDNGRRSASLADWLNEVHEADRERLRAAFAALVGGAPEAALREQARVRRAEGYGWFETHAVVAERDERGRPMRVVASLADVGERRALDERQRLAVNLFQHLHEGLLVTDAELRVLDVNPSYSQLLGVARQDLIGRVPALLRAPAGDSVARARLSAMWASLRTSGTWRGEVVEHRNGEPCALQLTMSVVHGDDGQPQYHVLLVSDITAQREQRERLERQAHFDELTRLPNRTRLTQALGDAMSASDREGHLLVVCYLDLDHFKPVNDDRGHAAGDRLLVELAQRLRGALRGNAAWADTVARLGGDEFVLLMRASTIDEAKLAVERVLRVVAEPYRLDAGEPVQVSASIGATVYPLDRSDADTLLRHADHAMYGAKQAGRNGYLFFDPEHSRRTEERVMAIGRVQEALDHHELELYYQPKVDMRRGVVLGVEALLRWNHPEHGLIPPAQFLPLIEHTGLSAHVGDWVLEHALEQLGAWQQDGVDLTVAVNVSARHLQETDFAQRLAELLARHARPLGPKLELEVLETAALADIGYTSSLLERCRRLGVRFSLDDFGTGYSTLTYLKRLPVDALKVDRSFVHNMLDDRQDMAIVEGVIGLARTFGCKVVAEGVETAAQARLLIEMGCDIGQGFGIASPMRASDVAAWVRDYRGPFSIAAAPRSVNAPE
jgi:diguanylate cyclase (GGDEF)-like protein/PAS domain S-box-containing protein